MTRRFEWSEAKAEINRRKHGVSFELATTVFDDPFALSACDRIENNEQRWRTIGAAHGMVLLVVAHTIFDEAEGARSFASFRRAGRSPRNENGMSRDKTVVQIVEPHAPLSAEREAELAELAAMADAPVDCSDLASLDDSFWKNARRNPFYRSREGETIVRLEPDVARWLEESGDVDSTINAVLRQAMAGGAEATVGRK